MRKSLLLSLSLVIGVLLVSDLALTQDLHPSRRPSPMGMARTMLGDCYVKVVYSRPYKRGRDNIFGTEEEKALVPYGKLWRTGANEATEITVTKDVIVGGKKLAAGTYSLFTTPGPEKWTVHFNTALGMSGTGYFNPETGEFKEGYSPENDIVVVTAPVKKLDEEVDQFTISFEKAGEGADMILKWIKTEIRVPVKVAE